MAGERLPKQRPHLIEGTKDDEETFLPTSKKDEEPPDRNKAENLGARLPHPDEEAGSIVFRFSSNMNEIRNDINEPRATASAAASEANRTLDEAEAQKNERRSTTSSSTKTRRRGVSALIEHRRQDDWTYTPCTCGGSGCSGGCDVLAGERLPKQRPQDEEHPGHNN